VSLFFITFYLLYSGLHCYIFLKARQAFHFRWTLGIPICVVFLVMILAPVIVRLLEKEGHESLARFTAYTGYSWLGLLFLFFSISISIDFLRLLMLASGLLLKMDFSPVISTYRFFFLAAFVTVAGKQTTFIWKHSAYIRIKFQKR